MLDTRKIRAEFPHLTKRIDLGLTNPAEAQRFFLDSTASTQMPLSVLKTLAGSVFDYANVHRGEYNASQKTTADFERTYNIAANFVNADSWREIILGRNTTEMINLVARGTASQFRDQDNIVVTRLEHNSNYVPWFALSQDAVKAGKKIDVRVVDFDRETGKLDMRQLARYVDKRTKMVCSTGASNFLGTKPDLSTIAEIAHKSGYSQPDGRKGSYFLVDGAQLVTGCSVDVNQIGCDFLAWSFHKMLAPLGVGALYGKKDILEQMQPFLYGGDMVEDVAEGKVTYKPLPWKFTAGTPNILGTIASGEAINFLINLGLGNLGDRRDYRVLGKQLETEILLNTARDDFPIKFTVPTESQDLFETYLAENPGSYEVLIDPEKRLSEVRSQVRTSMSNVMQHEQELTARALEGLAQIPNLTVYGPKTAEERAGLVAFTIGGIPVATAAKLLNKDGLELRHGTLCASLAHKHCGLEGSLRMGLYVYTTPEEVDRALTVIGEVSRGAIK